eukprot:g988.t1
MYSYVLMWPVFCRAEDAIERMKEATPSVFLDTTYAMYSSVLGGIVTDPRCMFISIDDHMVHRGHGVFDTCNVHDGLVYGLDFHMDRILRSAEKARIDVASKFEKEELIRIVLDTIAATGRKDDIFVRYCAALLSTDEVPEKPPLLATTKSNNYMINAIMAMEAQKRNVGLCIHVDHASDTLLESAVSSVAVLTQDGVLLAPSFDRILPSTTLQRVIDFAPALVAEGTIRAYEQRAIRIAELREASEIFEVGGGWIHPVTELDRQPVGSAGDVGPVFDRICDMLVDDLTSPENTHKIPGV